MKLSESTFHECTLLAGSCLDFCAVLRYKGKEIGILDVLPAGECDHLSASASQPEPFAISIESCDNRDQSPANTQV